MEPNQNTNMQNATSIPTSTGVSNASSTSLNMPGKSVESSKPGSDVVFQGKSKKSHGMLYGMILLAILAVGGIGFGVWAMMDGNSKVEKKDKQITELQSQLTEKSETVVEDDTTVADGSSVKNVSNELAQNLISPYIGSFTYLNDIFDHDFNENTKFYVAFQNTSLNWFSGFGKSGIGADTAFLRYDDINDRYKYLFGEDKDLDKVNYQEGYNTFTYEKDGFGGEGFTVERVGGGGTMSALFSIIKEAYYDEDSLVVDVYHDKINVCVVEGADENYCVKEMGYRTILDEEMKQIIDNNTDKVSVYSMVFKNSGDHYYLSSINKQ